MPAMPAGVEEGILRGIYLLHAGRPSREPAPRVQLLGSGAILHEAVRARTMLAERCGVARRRLERDQLQGAAPRRPRGRALELPAPEPSRRARPTSRACLAGRARAGRRGDATT